MDTVYVVVASFLLISLLLVVFLWYRFCYSPYQVFKSVGISHPPVTPFIGNIMQITKQGLIEAFENDINKYGKVFGWYIGTLRWIIVADADMFKDIFVRSADCFNERPESGLMAGSRGELPAGLIFMKKKQWRAIRPIVSPTFSIKKLKMMSPFIERSCVSLKERLSEICASGHSADVFDVYGQFTMETVLGAAFGSQVNVLKGEGDSLTEAAAGVLSEVEIKPILWTYVIMSYFPNLFKMLFVMANPKMRRSFSFLKEFGFHLIKERRERADTPSQNKDFLQLLMDAKSPEDATSSENDKKTLTDREIVGLCVDFLLAGFETTKNTMSYVSYLLSLNTEKQDLLCNAIDKYYEDNEDATLYDASQEIQYLEWVVQEGLRVYPPLSRLARTCCEDCVINGVTFVKDSVIMIPVKHLHHSPEYWEQPEQFIPERFSPEGKEGRHPLCYLPFGWGQRSCIGMRFALMEIKMALVNVLREYKFERSPDTEIPLKVTQGLTQYPTNGVYLNIVKR